MPSSRLREGNPSAAGCLEPLPGRPCDPGEHRFSRLLHVGLRRGHQISSDSGWRTSMTPLCAERTLKLFCYSSACRQIRIWNRMLESAPVYACAGCGTTREIHELGRRTAIALPTSDQTLMRMIRAAGQSYELLDAPRAFRWNKHEDNFAEAPFCGCCGTACLMVLGQPVRRCVCVSISTSCVKCGRGACHCKCQRSWEAEKTTVARRLRS